MKMVERLFMIFVMNLVYGKLSSQVSCDSTNWAKPGTYEIINIPGSYENSTLPKLNINSEFLCLIESKRESTKIVNYQYSPTVLIKIYPKNIKSKEEVLSK